MRKEKRSEGIIGRTAAETALRIRKRTMLSTLGSDGKQNNLIGIVTNKGVKKSIEKGNYPDPTELKNGTKDNNAFYIDANVLKAADEVLDLAMSKKGENREFGTTLNKNREGTYQMTESGIKEGKPADLAKGENAGVETEQGDVIIHSHPTGAVQDANGKPGDMSSVDASMPTPEDRMNMDKVEMSIIVGKNDEAQQRVDGTGRIITNDDREANINVFTKDDKYNPKQTIKMDEGKKILKDHEKR